MLLQPAKVSLKIFYLKSSWHTVFWVPVLRYLYLYLNIKRPWLRPCGKLEVFQTVWKKAQHITILVGKSKIWMEIWQDVTKLNDVCGFISICISIFCVVLMSFQTNRLLKSTKLVLTIHSCRLLRGLNILGTILDHGFHKACRA